MQPDNKIWSVNRIYMKTILKNHTQNVVDKLVQDSKKSKFSGSVLKFAFIVCPDQGLPKYFKIKVLSTCLNFI